MMFIRSKFQFAQESLNLTNSGKDLLCGTARSEYARPRGTPHLTARGGIQKGLPLIFLFKTWLSVEAAV